MSMTRLWTLIGALAVIVILFAGYAVGVGPAYNAAADSDAQLAEVEIQNQVKAAELARLKTLSENSDELFAELEDLQRAIPSGHDTSVFAAQLEALAAKAGVKLAKISYINAEEAVAPPSDTATAEPAEGDDAAAEDSTTVDTESPAIAQEVSSVPGLVSVAVTIEVVGDYESVHRFLGSAQEGIRVFTLETVTIDGSTSAAEYELKVSGYVYVLPGTFVSTVDADTGADGTTVG
ncbi:Pilus assembly protein PilO [Salinibacterium sp. NYA9b]